MGAAAGCERERDAKRGDSVHGFLRERYWYRKTTGGDPAKSFDTLHAHRSGRFDDVQESYSSIAPRTETTYSDPVLGPASARSLACSLMGCTLATFAACQTPVGFDAPTSAWRLAD